MSLRRANCERTARVFSRTQGPQAGRNLKTANPFGYSALLARSEQSIGIEMSFAAVQESVPVQVFGVRRETGKK
jgi:hypothetical protein